MKKAEVLLGLVFVLVCTPISPILIPVAVEAVVLVFQNNGQQKNLLEASPEWSVNQKDKIEKASRFVHYTTLPPGTCIGSLNSRPFDGSGNAENYALHYGAVAEHNRLVNDYNKVMLRYLHGVQYSTSSTKNLLPQKIKTCRNEEV